MIIFIPGLTGINTLKEDFARATKIGLNERVVRDFAENTQLPYLKLPYQFSANQNSDGQKNDTLGVWEKQIALQLRNIDLIVSPQQPIIIVASSVGYHIAIGALSKLDSMRHRVGLLGLKPVPDALHAIALQLRDPIRMKSLEKGKLKKIEVPIESADGKKDCFMLTKAHVNDPDATRFLTSPIDVMKFNPLAGSAVTESTIIYGKDDHLTPSFHMRSVQSNIWSAETELIACDGGHGDDLTLQLQEQLYEIVARLG